MCVKTFRLAVELEVQGERDGSVGDRVWVGSAC